jgi:hypothetical protein
MRIIESTEYVVVSGGLARSITEGGSSRRSVSTLGEVVCSGLGEGAGRLSSRVGCTSQACQQVVSQVVGELCTRAPATVIGVVTLFEQSPTPSSSSTFEPVMADEFSGTGGHGDGFAGGGGDFAGAGAGGGWDGFDSYDA